MPHFSCFPFLHCLLIDSFYHPLWISDSSPPFLGPRHCPFHFSTPIPPWCFLSCPTRQTKYFSLLVPFYLLSYYHILSSICNTLYLLCSSTFRFSFSPILCFLATSTPHVAQLCLLQETLSPVFFRLHSHIVISSTLHKNHHFSGCRLPLHTHCCSPWGQSSYSTMLFHFLPYFLQQYRLLLLSLPYVRTLLLLMSLFSASKAFHLFPHHLLSPHLPYSTLHYSTFQHFEPISPYCFLLLFLSTPVLLGKVLKPPTLPTYSSFSTF